MSEQAVDLRAIWAVIRRHGAVLVVVAVLGALAGGGLLLWAPPAYTSTSAVLLPSIAQPGSGRTGGYDAETQMHIVKSSEILTRAGSQVVPRLTEAQVTERVSVDAPAPSILEITASGPTARQAEGLALSVAQSLVAYLEDARKSLGAARRAQLQGRLNTLKASLATVTAEIRKATDRIAVEGRTSPAGPTDAAALSELIAVRATTVLEIDALQQQISGAEGASAQEADPGTSASLIQRPSPGAQHDYVADAAVRVLGGSALLLLAACLLLVGTNQRDPKLRSRDEIADAVDIPVVASLRVRPPRSAAAWAELLRSYSPDSVDGWALRRLLHDLTTEMRRDGPVGEPLVLVVICISGDTGALAVAPQIAAFAASTGLTTQFVAAQHHECATALWAACSQGFAREGLPPTLSVTTAPELSGSATLTVRLVVLDRTRPGPDATVVAGGTGLLAVSSATASRRNLADAVVAADRVGLTVEGIVVANPDPLDRTTGRLAPVERRPARDPHPRNIAEGPLPGPATIGSQHRSQTREVPR
ncbi:MULTISPECIES: Wzz/FepE/Etk N-terminal domain-containing protein [unclassified Knoellia]|uniref:Wzz/FepE/Etk N-terminal domain-containing protein n=1 Tax=Knoellia altitudinis TaxID=3404795 RepID=UPI0036195878